MIQLFWGSIFNSKCDLLIIPCNSRGGMTDTIYKELVTNELPYWNETIRAGEVAFVQNTGNFANASIIGFAASVDAEKKASSEVVLRNILHSIKQYCMEQSFQKVNIPLLGTGAGKLSEKFVYEIMKEEFGDDLKVSLCVYVISQTMYNALVAEKEPKKNIKVRNPRVFISYAGLDEDNRKWVKDLACRLRSCGVNARLDMFHLKPGQDLPQWMTNELIMADKVLLICDKYYAQKADNRKGGVGWETMIIQGDMLSRQDQNKYIAILRDSDIDRSLPIYVKSRYALDWSGNRFTNKEFDELLLNLFDCDIEPPIGEIPDFVKEKLTDLNEKDNLQ